MNDGTSLEEIVSCIERIYLPKGFSVDTRKKEYDGDGFQTAEFDIYVKGKLGTADILYLIECRNRPSEGAAPKSWIEQLAGRKQIHNFDKVMAVSTTGFTKVAVDAANKLGVALRTVSQLINGELFIDMPIVCPSVIRSELLQSIRFHLLDDTIPIGEVLETKVELNDVRIAYGSSIPEPLDIFWNTVKSNIDIFAGVQIGEERLKTITVDQKIFDPFRLINGTTYFEISSIEFDTLISIYEIPMEICDSGTYSEVVESAKSSTQFAKYATWQSNNDAAIKKITLIKLK